MTVTRPIPDDVIRTWPTVDPAAWEWLSEHRLQAPHGTVDGAVYLVVVAFGETLGQSLDAGHSEQRVRETYARLFEAAAQRAARRVACAEGTPAGSDSFGGRCGWCGRWPVEHNAVTFVKQRDDTLVHVEWGGPR